MQKQTLANLYKTGVFTSISRLRKNSSGYYYVTLLKPQGDKTSSTNIYFGKKTAEIVEGTFNIGDSMAQFLKNAEVVQTENKDGEVRFKLSTSDNSNYSSEAELNEMWGNSDEKSTFNTELFKKTFSTEEVVVVPQGA